MSNNYDDIISLPHPTSKNHPRMPMIDRAAQFSPFAALTGYDDDVKETARLTDRKVELDEDEKQRLDFKLQIIKEKGKDSTQLTITYFVPDAKKAGGKYVSATGFIKRIDDFEHTVILTDKTIIPIEQISEIEGDLFRGMEL